MFIILFLYLEITFITIVIVSYYDKFYNRKYTNINVTWHGVGKYIYMLYIIQNCKTIRMINAIKK